MLLDALRLFVKGHPIGTSGIEASLSFQIMWCYTHLSHGRRSSRNSEDFEDITRCPRTLRPAKPALSWLQNESRKWFFLCQVERDRIFMVPTCQCGPAIGEMCDSAFVGCRSGPGRVSCQVSDHPAWDRGGSPGRPFVRDALGLGLTEAFELILQTVPPNKVHRRPFTAFFDSLELRRPPFKPPYMDIPKAAEVSTRHHF